MNISDKLESVYLLHMPELKEYPNSLELLDKYSKFMLVRADVLKAIENARNEKIIGKSMSAKLVIYPNDSVKELLSSIKYDLATIFIVSEFCLSDVKIDGEAFDSGLISVSAREGVICDRCWKVVDEVSEAGLCSRCQEIGVHQYFKFVISFRSYIYKLG